MIIKKNARIIKRKSANKVIELLEESEIEKLNDSYSERINSIQKRKSKKKKSYVH